MSDPITKLVVNAIGCGVMLALESRDELTAQLRALPPAGSLADALRPEAMRFIRARADLVEGLGSRKIETIEELEALPSGSVIRCRHGWIHVKDVAEGCWWTAGSGVPRMLGAMDVPVQLLELGMDEPSEMVSHV